MRCVCGCRRREHRRVVMSVPLAPQVPRYAIVGSLIGVARTHPRAPYAREECRCGCGEFLADGD